MSEPASPVFAPSFEEPAPKRRARAPVMGFLLAGAAAVTFSGFVWAALLRPGQTVVVKADPQPYRTALAVEEPAAKPTTIDDLIERAVEAAPKPRAAAAMAPAQAPVAPAKPMDVAVVAAKPTPPEEVAFPKAQLTEAPPLKPGPLPAPTEVLAPPPPKPSAPAAEPKKKPGAHAVQLGALASEAAAEALRQELLGKRRALLGGLDLRVERGQAGQAAVFRVRAHGLADPAAAKALCGKLSEAGQACMVVRG